MTMKYRFVGGPGDGQEVSSDDVGLAGVQAMALSVHLEIGQTIHFGPTVFQELQDEHPEQLNPFLQPPAYRVTSVDESAKEKIATLEFVEPS